MHRACARLLALAVLWVSANGDPGTDSLQDALIRLREAGGWEPKGIIDVGAHRAGWAMAAREVFPSAEFLLLEGDADLEPSLKDFGEPYEITIIGARDGKITWHEHPKHKTGNSIFLENTHTFREGSGGMRKVERQMRTLDSIVAARGDAITYNLLKCDVQGAELDVIRGAKRTLENIDVVILEVSLLQYNDGAPRASRVISSMFLRGFDLLDVVEMHYWDSHTDNVQVLGQMDLLFAKRDSPLFDAYGRTMDLLVGRRKRRGAARRVLGWGRR